jgi:hypothetical protein
MSAINLEPADSAPIRRLSDDDSFSGVSSIAVTEKTESVRLSDSTYFTGVSRIEIRREGARQLVSVIIVSSLLFIVVASFGMLLVIFLKSDPPPTMTDLRQVLEILLAPVVGIVGAVTGFYFGSGSAMQRGDIQGSGNPSIQR